MEPLKSHSSVFPHTSTPFWVCINQQQKSVSHSLEATVFRRETSTECHMRSILEY